MSKPTRREIGLFLLIAACPVLLGSLPLVWLVFGVEAGIIGMLLGFALAGAFTFAAGIVVGIGAGRKKPYVARWVLALPLAILLGVILHAVILGLLLGDELFYEATAVETAATWDGLVALLGQLAFIVCLAGMAIGFWVGRVSATPPTPVAPEDVAVDLLGLLIGLAMWGRGGNGSAGGRSGGGF